MYKIYHNPRCSKSRAGLQFMESKGVELEIIQYMKDTITEEELNDLIIKLNIKPFDLIRTHEALYKSDFKGKEFTDEEWVKIMVQHPKLIHRPIVVGEYKAILGNPADKLEDFFNK